MTLTKSQMIFVLISVVFFQIIGVLFTFQFEKSGLNYVTCFGLSFFYLLSFCGSVLLINSFRNKPVFWLPVLPFSAITLLGTIIGAIIPLTWITGEPWPFVLNPVAIFNILSMLLAPAVTLLFIPVVRILNLKQVEILAAGLLISLLAFVCLFIYLNQRILPAFDPEFVRSEFWTFSMYGTGETLFGLYYSIGLLTMAGLILYLGSLYSAKFPEVKIHE